MKIRILKAVYWFLLLVAFLYSYREFLFKKLQKYRYSNSIKYLLLLMMFSVFTAYYSWSQPFDLSIRGLLPYLSFVLFFVLLKLQPNLELIEKLIWMFCFSYIICYLYSLFNFPNVTFGDESKGIHSNRGVYRFFIPGRSFIYLGFFLALSKYSIKKSKFWLISTIALFAFIVLHVIRQYILITFVIGFFVIFKELVLWKKISFISVVVLIVSYVYSRLPFLQLLVKITEGQIVNSGSEDIRTKAYSFFFTEFSPNIFSFLFGNGVPHYSSPYGSYYIHTLNYKGIYMSDVGYAQVFALFGLLGLLILVHLFYKVIVQKDIKVECSFAKWYIIFLAFANVLSGLVLLNSTILTICIALYVLESCYSSQNNLMIEVDEK
ncbi:hypothetical protein [Flavicella sp.]|uniref:hypothetical protein n=1 Tax=Flavicella sp. TaxID=2957742 RepID=UPI003015A6A5